MSQAQNIDRRSFLKYAGTGIAIAGAVAVGYYDYSIKQRSAETAIISPTTTVTPTPKPTLSPTPTSPTPAQTPTPTPTGKIPSLYGRLFFDYSGNGFQEPDEPAVAKVKVRLKDALGNIVEAVSDSSGDYKLEDIKTGSYRFYIEADKKFRYMCRSTREFRPATGVYDILLSSEPKIDIGLMEGFLTLPFPKGARETRPRDFVDLDTRQGYAGDWRGGQNARDTHLGTDFFVPRGTQILAATPGRVIESLYHADDGHRITIQHPDGNLTIYCHLSSREAEVNQEMRRGDKIGLSGNTGRLVGPNPHLHFQFGGFGLGRIDPYRDINNPSSKSYWTRDNEPQYPF